MNPRKAFNPRKVKEALAEAKKAHTEANIEVNRLIKAVFNTPDGEVLLKHLESKTVDRKTEPFAFPVTMDQQLEYWMHRRFREGQNNIVEQLRHEKERVIE